MLVPNKPATIFDAITIGNIFTNKVLHVCFKVLSPEVHGMVFFFVKHPVVLSSFGCLVGVPSLCMCVSVMCFYYIFCLVC